MLTCTFSNEPFKSAEKRARGDFSDDFQARRKAAKVKSFGSTEIVLHIAQFKKRGKNESNSRFFHAAVLLSSFQKENGLVKRL